jgi:ribosomal protein L9
MKTIQLECRTAGFSHGEVVAIGKGDGEISLAEAKALVESGMAKEYLVPKSGKQGPADKGEIAKLEAEVEALEKELGEAKSQLEVANTELTMMKAAQDGKADPSKK